MPHSQALHLILALQVSVWHRQVNSVGDSPGGSQSQLQPALVVHDSEWSMFKPAGSESSSCSSLHGPHCPSLRDRFQAEPALQQLLDRMAGQAEVSWWSSGARSREQALTALVENTNRILRQEHGQETHTSYDALPSRGRTYS